MSFFKRDLGLISTGVVLGATLVFGQMVFADKTEPRPDLPLDELRTFSEVFGRIKNTHLHWESKKRKMNILFSQMQIAPLSRFIGYATWLQGFQKKKLSCWVMADTFSIKNHLLIS